MTPTHIGIDPGTHTGIALYSSKTKELELYTMKIHEAMKMVAFQHDMNSNIVVRFEDARLRTWFGTAGREQLQGAGSIKRDCTIWEDYLTDCKIKFEKVAPRNNRTKLDAEQFKQITGYSHRTNEHCRDAAMLIYGL